MMQRSSTCTMIITCGLVMLGCDQNNAGQSSVPPTPVTTDAPAGTPELAQRFAITFPGNWQLSRNKMGMALIGSAPLDGGDDVFAENVNINEIDNPSGLDLHDFYAQQFQLDVARERLTNFELVSEVNQIINNQAAKRTVYRHRMGAFDLTAFVYTFVSATHGYVITCTTENDWVRQYEDRFESIIRTFRTQ